MELLFPHIESLLKRDFQIWKFPQCYALRATIFFVQIDHIMKYIKCTTMTIFGRISINFWWILHRVSSKASFSSKQPKPEPKLVLTLSETKRLFQLFPFFTKSASFGVSIEPKQIKGQRKHRLLTTILPTICQNFILIALELRPNWSKMRKNFCGIKN